MKSVQDRGAPVTYGCADRRRQKGFAVSASRKPPPSLDGELRFDDQVRTAAAEDFGHLVHRTPEGVLLPASEADVVAAVAAATRRLRRTRNVRQVDSACA